MNDELFYSIALKETEGVGDILYKILTANFTDASTIFNTSKGRLLKINGVGEKVANAILSKQSFSKAEKLITQAEAQQASIIPIGSAFYPDRLQQLNDAPPLLYYKGDTEILNAPRIISIVGTRNATRYGRDFLDHLFEGLTQLNVVVISGLAYGIDVYAHQLCLQYEIPTIGALAGGIDRIYPAEHISIANDMCKHGGLLSENPFGNRPNAPKFPARNRIIAGMADATIVVEASIKGGAMITAELAHGYNKDVFALPGNFNQNYSKGTNFLLKTNKASLITSVNDLMYLMNWDMNYHETAQKQLFETVEFTEDERLLVNLLTDHASLTVDELVIKTQTKPNKLASTLLSLEFKGVVNALPGNAYVLSTN